MQPAGVLDVVTERSGQITNRIAERSPPLPAIRSRLHGRHQALDRFDPVFLPVGGRVLIVAQRQLRVSRLGERYFHSGRRICLVGALALGDTRDRFASQGRDYFAGWVAALAGALTRSCRDKRQAEALAEEAVAGIQGAIVLARALNDPGAFSRAMAKLRVSLAAPSN